MANSTAVISEKAEELVNKINLTELHKTLVFSGANSNVIIWMDGTFDALSSNSWPGEDIEKWVVLKAWGNVDSTFYSEGFYTETENEDGEYGFLNPDTNKFLTRSEMINECIEEGCFDDFKDDIGNQIKIELESRLCEY